MQPFKKLIKKCSLSKLKPFQNGRMLRVGGEARWQQLQGADWQDGNSCRGRTGTAAARRRQL